MKLLTVIIYIFVISQISYGDCSAPTLSLRKHEGSIHGFNVKKIWDKTEITKEINTENTLLEFGDYYYLISSVDTKMTPAKVSEDLSEISIMLLRHLVSSKNYLNTEKQVFTVSDVIGYDLTNNGEANLILFNTSPGANVYSGAIGIIENEWVTLVEPTCY